MQPSHGEDDRENPDDSFSADPDKDIASTHHVDFILEVSVCDMMAVVNHQTQVSDKKPEEFCAIIE